MINQFVVLFSLSHSLLRFIYRFYHSDSPVTFEKIIMNIFRNVIYTRRVSYVPHLHYKLHNYKQKTHTSINVTIFINLQENSKIHHPSVYLKHVLKNVNQRSFRLWHVLKKIPSARSVGENSSTVGAKTSNRKEIVKDLNSSTQSWHLLYTRSYEKRKGRLRLAEATVAAAQPREIMALVTAVHL